MKRDGGIAKQIARWVALGALFLIPFAPLIVADTYFFPFITGKAFYLRILIEIAVVAWLVLALLDKEYRPRFSWIGVVAVAFVAWMFVANTFALNPTKAFWSNFERMEGWVLLIHLLGFFFAASTILRVEKKWRAWFFTSIGVAVVVCIYALLQLTSPAAFPVHLDPARIDAFFGNPIYLAIYLLFTTFISGWLALTERNAWLRGALIVFSAVTAILIFYTGTRGAIIGLAAGLMLAFVLTAITAARRARLAAVGALILLIVIIGGFYAARDSAFVQNNPILERLTSISLAHGETRFTIWSMAFEGMKERPLLGWGQEGFNYVFNKYYDPSLYLQEQWFDRAHNAFVDWLIAGGVPAFLLYISLFGSAIILLWRRPELSRPERIMLTSALISYAVHNFFVFDNLYSYIYFFVVLAFIDSQASSPIHKLEMARELSAKLGSMYALPAAGIILTALLWHVNIANMQVASKLFIALSPTNDITNNINVFKDLIDNPSFAQQEVREQLVSFAGSVVQNASATDEQKKEVAMLAITEMKKQVDLYPQDARAYFKLSLAYRIAGDGASALQALESAINLSPKKIGFYIEKGTIEWIMGDIDAARRTFDIAYSLGKQFPTVALHAAAGHIATGNQESGDAILNKAFGTTDVDSDILSVAYYHAENWPRLIRFWNARADKPGASVETLFGLASAYYVSGDAANAKRVIKSTMKKFPESAGAAAEALKQIEESR